MNYKIVLIVIVCLNSALADDCTNAQPVELSRDLMECCNNNETYLLVIGDPCFKERNLNSIECMMECLYTDHNLMVNDTIILENVKLFLQPISDDRNRYINGAEFCDQFGKEKILQKFGHFQTKAECKDYYMLFDICIALNAITRCPESTLSKSNYCTSQVKFLNQCVFSG